MNRPNRYLRAASPDVAAILDTAAGLHGVRAEALLGRGRTKAVTRARRQAMAEIRDRYGWSLSEIGRLFGRDHTTVMYHLREADTE